MSREGKMDKQDEPDFHLACKAKEGDQDAVTKLWLRYRKIMVGMVMKYYPYHQLTDKEIEADCFEVMIHKLNLFDPKKWPREPEIWKFSYWLTGGSGHLRNRLKNQAMRDRNIEPYDDNVDENEDQEIIPKTVKQALAHNDFPFTVYSPETVLNETPESLEKKKKLLFENLSPFQKLILKLRRQGESLYVIADQMGCSYTKVRCAIRDAKDIASYIFDTQYVKRRIA